MIDKGLNFGRPIIQRFVADAGPRVVLDIGAGTGIDLGLIRAACPSARLIALEAEPSQVARLRAQGYEVVSADLERDRIPLDDESVDAIVANQVLEHVKEVFWILHEASRILRVGGSFIIGVPNLASAHNRLLLLLGQQPTSIQNWSAHVRGYTKHDLVRLLDKPFPGGYRLVEWRGTNFYPFPPSLASVAARAWKGGAVGIVLRFEKVARYEDSYLRYPHDSYLETNFFTGSDRA